MPHFQPEGLGGTGVAGSTQLVFFKKTTLTLKTAMKK